MLVRLYHTCCQKIREETGVSSDQVMAYIHYPPSVYQLHIHFKYPLGPPSHDAFRVHLLSTVINNLAIDGDYYKKSLLQLPVYLNTDLHSALAARPASPIKTMTQSHPILSRSIHHSARPGHRQCLVSPGASVPAANGPMAHAGRRPASQRSAAATVKRGPHRSAGHARWLQAYRRPAFCAMCASRDKATGRGQEKLMTPQLVGCSPRCPTP